MKKRLLSGLTAAVLLAVAGQAQAQCEDMVVIVRNSVYRINGLEAVCKEFNQMKADLAGMKSALSRARQENAMLRGQLTVSSARPPELGVAPSVPIPRAQEIGDVSR